MDPPLPLARMRARGELLEVRADDLSCTPDEAAPWWATVLERSDLSASPTPSC
jgi:LuxR family maltose regulon positive regulatory protein